MRIRKLLGTVSVGKKVVGGIARTKHSAGSTSRNWAPNPAYVAVGGCHALIACLKVVRFSGLPLRLFIRVEPSTQNPSRDLLSGTSQSISFLVNVGNMLPARRVDVLVVTRSPHKCSHLVAQQKDILTRHSARRDL